jgi:hypothetical protein
MAAALWVARIEEVEAGQLAKLCHSWKLAIGEKVVPRSCFDMIEMDLGSVS